jgi:hypothetical protein
VGDREFLDQWDRQFADWCADDLMRDGTEAALLAPLARHRWAAARLVEHAGASEDHRHRKAAAILAGFIEDPPQGLLDDLFERESERGALASADTLEPLYCQSVVEDVVLAAARWSRRPVTRPPALELLRKIVERTVVGEYWSTASYAMATLCRYHDPNAPELLRSFGEFAAAPPPAHPANPTLGTERLFAQGLQAGAAPTLDAVEAILEAQEAAALSVQFEPDTQAALDAWMALARQIG